ncbi:orotidine-5'-phosphate decarboxylase [Candidatus Calescamantes bacterium]|nr:orotidine-5'-phosphate decarboxylase [Candidatus Calescamantes bacterium]
MKERTNPVILALDLPSLEGAKEAIDKFSPFIEIFKIGPFLFYRYGWKSVELVKNAGKKVFLDLKLHDIPKVMGEGMKIIASQEVDFATIHLQAGENGVRKAVENKGNTKILGVTLLTSIDEKDLGKIGVKISPHQLVRNLVEQGKSWGIDGVICSCEEVASLRKNVGEEFLLITPGVGWEKAGKDQKRKGTVYQALRNGADFVVMGRSLLQDEKAEEKLKRLREYLEKI